MSRGNLNDNKELISKCNSRKKGSWLVIQLEKTAEAVIMQYDKRMARNGRQIAAALKIRKIKSLFKGT